MEILNISCEQNERMDVSTCLCNGKIIKWIKSKQKQNFAKLFRAKTFKLNWYEGSYVCQASSRFKDVEGKLSFHERETFQHNFHK